MVKGSDQERRILAAKKYFDDRMESKVVTLCKPIIYKLAGKTLLYDG
jgi:tyrosyl-tRNA synthetase